jgi:CheY-like chemotaxis protein
VVSLRCRGRETPPGGHAVASCRALTNPSLLRRGPNFRLAGRRPGQLRCDPDVMTLRCLIVDDSPRFLDAARGLLERQGLLVVGVASSCAEALQRVSELRPDIALVDIDLGGESGFDVARRLSREVGLGRTRMILISTHAEADYTELIAASPVVGFLPKSMLSADAIRELLTSRGDGHPVDPVSGPPGR